MYPSRNRWQFLIAVILRREASGRAWNQLCDAIGGPREGGRKKKALEPGGDTIGGIHKEGFAMKCQRGADRAGADLKEFCNRQRGQCPPWASVWVLGFCSDSVRFGVEPWAWVEAREKQEKKTK